MSALQKERDALADAAILNECRVTELRAELREVQKRHLLDLARGGKPSLSIRWAEDCPWPGGAASPLGAQRLRQALGGQHTAELLSELVVGPPPADWRTLLSLGLRKGQPAEPALL